MKKTKIVLWIIVLSLLAGLLAIAIDIYTGDKTTTNALLKDRLVETVTPTPFQPVYPVETQVYFLPNISNP